MKNIQPMFDCAWGTPQYNQTIGDGDGLVESCDQWLFWHIIIIISAGHFQEMTDKWQETPSFIL